MPRLCTVCQHPQRHSIDKALVAGGNLREMSALYRVSEDALGRHKAEHLPVTLVKAQAATEVQQALDVLGQLRAINGAAFKVLTDARTAGDGELVLKAIDRVLKQIELQAKLLGELDDRPVVNVLLSPEWLALRGRIVAALRPHPAAFVALAEVLDADAG
jgi:hypothetical protein